MKIVPEWNHTKYHFKIFIPSLQLSEGTGAKPRGPSSCPRRSGGSPGLVWSSLSAVVPEMSSSEFHVVNVIDKQKGFAYIAYFPPNRVLLLHAS